MPTFGSRHVLVLMGFLGLAIVYLLRVNLNVTIVVMVTQNNSKEVNISGDCPVSYSPNSSITDDFKKGEFDWTPYDQGVILGSLYYGYVVTCFLAGPLAERLGGKLIFGVSILTTALLTLLTPTAARHSKNSLIALRVMEGIFEGLAWPAMHTICGRWLPNTERGFLYSVIHTGAQFGTVIGYPIAGVLCTSTFLGGWPAAFYIFGLAGLVWFVFWWYLVFETPSQHPRITLEEKEYIMKQIEVPTMTGHFRAPLKKILTSLPVWAVAITSFLTHWVFEMIFVDLPTFLDSLLHFNIKANGLLSSLPHLLHVLVQWSGGYLSDLMIGKGHEKTAVRKSLNLFSCLLTALCFGGVITAGCDSFWVMVCLVVGTGIMGLNVPSFQVALLDMAPSFAGTLMGVTNAVGNISSFVAPLVVGLLTSDGQTRDQWNKAFYIVICLSLLAGLVFSYFGSSELQPWATSTISLDTLSGRVDSHGQSSDARVQVVQLPERYTPKEYDSNHFRL